MASYALSGVKFTGIIDTRSLGSSLHRSLNDINHKDVTNDIDVTNDKKDGEEKKSRSETDSDTEVDVSALKFTENAPDYDTLEFTNVTNAIPKRC